MKFSQIITGLAGLAAVSATQSICDKYTTALFAGKGGDSEANQELLLTLVVNTALIGNYAPNPKAKVTGILTPTTYNGESVNLLQYFNGYLASTNMGGKCGVSVNFLDDGGAAPLKMNKPSNTMNSNQYFLVTHLYKFFASLLGCSKFGKTVKPYDGDPSMGSVHKFMALDANEFGYFVSQVGASAASFGVSSADISAVAGALNSLFGYRCEPPQSIPPVPSPNLQSICQDCDCPLSPNPDCKDYGPVIEPKPAKYSKNWCGSRDWRKSMKYCHS